MPDHQPSDHDILIRLDEKVSNLHRSVDALTGDHENRIRGLEREANRWLGKQSVIGGIIGIAFSLIGSVIQAGSLKL